MPPTLADLNAHFAIRDRITFHEDEPGMVQMRIAAPAAEATIYLQGAHLTRWTPLHASPVLYLSPKTAYTPGKAIRGGVPVLFPWFGDRWNGAEWQERTGMKSPAHGFARSSVWTVERTHLSPDGEVHVTLSLGPSEQSRSLGYDDFTATMEFRIGAELHQSLTVTNHGEAPMPFECGFHTYFAVGDIDAVRVDGLRGSTYIDKRDGGTRKVQRETQLAFTRDTDQLHVQTLEPLVLHDPAQQRAVRIEKIGSQSTVVWNPSTVLKHTLPDLPEDAWQRFCCVEVVNAADDRITLASGASHGMSMTLSLQPE